MTSAPVFSKKKRRDSNTKREERVNAPGWDLGHPSDAAVPKGESAAFRREFGRKVGLLARPQLAQLEDVARRGLRRFAAGRRRVKARLGVLHPPRVDLYLGWGTSDAVELRGRAFEDEPIRETDISDNRWTNLVRSFRLFESDELPGLEVDVAVGDACGRCKTGPNGYFRIKLELPTPLSGGWHEYRATPCAEAVGEEAGAERVGRFLIPSVDARFGVVSDIDDTILQTHVRNLPKMVYVTVLGNALSRRTFEGAPYLYRGLERGGHGAPFFYVSRSAWNIHSLLEGFLRHNEFPLGPLLLRDVGWFSPLPKENRGKALEIRRLLERYPELPFVLIGDSGQRDADIYTQLAGRFKGRICAILIRDVGAKKRADRARKVLSDHPNAPSLLFSSDREAVDWCRRQGLWIEPK